ncbi:hypothetical protein O181_013223 [Austropuccinia psidii MF-1]|uniref:Uncharacterized protein n=1 Tax=Austropuccinia psidii MF-1 TaxID=1389203 RepID=A0A9Q3BYA0_9BASI|nr:hypothetical protein [Austropuccinia psidii MF-1]
MYSCSEFPISRINRQVIIKSIRAISDFTNDVAADKIGEFHGEGVEMVNHSIGQLLNSSRTQPPMKKFQSKLIQSTPQSFNPRFCAITTSGSGPSPILSTSKQPIRPSTSQPPAMTPSNSLQIVGSSSHNDAFEISSLLHLASQVFHRRHVSLRLKARSQEWHQNTIKQW